MSLKSKIEKECGKDAIYNMLMSDDDYLNLNLSMGAFKVALSRYFELKKLIKTPIDVCGEFLKDVLAKTGLNVYPNVKIASQTSPTQKTSSLRKTKSASEENVMKTINKRSNELSAQDKDILSTAPKMMSRRYDLVISNTNYPPLEVSEGVLVYVKKPNLKNIPVGAKGICFFSPDFNLVAYNITSKEQTTLTTTDEVAKYIISLF